jgi:hypothetical protein
VPERVARDHPRHDVRYVAVADAEPAVVSPAWDPRRRRPAIEAFIETTRQIAGGARLRRSGM